MEAVVMIHWPGKDTPACAEHARQLQGVAHVLGIGKLAGTPMGPGTECANCENEAKKAASR